MVESRTQVRHLVDGQLVGLHRRVTLLGQQGLSGAECLHSLPLGVGADGGRPRCEERREGQLAGQLTGLGILHDLAGLRGRRLRGEAELGDAGTVHQSGEGGQGADQHRRIRKGCVQVRPCQWSVGEQGVVGAVADDPAVERRGCLEQPDDVRFGAGWVLAEIGEVHAQRLLGEEREVPPGIDESGDHGASLKVDLRGLAHCCQRLLFRPDVGDRAVTDGDGFDVRGLIALHREDGAVEIDDGQIWSGRSRGRIPAVDLVSHRARRA